MLRPNHHALQVLKRSTFLKKVYFSFCALVRLPLNGAIQYIFHSFGLSSHSGAVKIKVGDEHSISLRSNHTDLKVFEQVFLQQDCEIPIERFQPKLIIDGGAHIGCTSVYFALKYPSAKIICVEAERRNFAQLCRNVESFPNIEPIHSAIHSHRGLVTIENPENDGWGFRVQEAKPDHEAADVIPTTTIADLVLHSGYNCLDVLKLDIEGAELDIFREPCEWLNIVSVIIIELHDRIKPGCSAAFEKAVAGYAFVTQKTAHNVVWMKQVCNSG
jgi:FkbM family methyltransferase